AVDSQHAPALAGHAVPAEADIAGGHLQRHEAAGTGIEAGMAQQHAEFARLPPGVEEALHTQRPSGLIAHVDVVREAEGPHNGRDPADVDAGLPGHGLETLELFGNRKATGLVGGTTGQEYTCRQYGGQDATLHLLPLIEPAPCGQAKLSAGTGVAPRCPGTCPGPWNCGQQQSARDCTSRQVTPPAPPPRASAPAGSAGWRP